MSTTKAAGGISSASISLSDGRRNEVLLENQRYGAAKSGVSKFVQRNDLRRARDWRFLFRYALDDRSDALPNSRNFPDADDQPWSETRYEHCGSDAEIVGHPLDRFDRALVALLAETHDVFETR